MHAAGVLKWQQEFRAWVYGDGPQLKEPEPPPPVSVEPPDLSQS